MCMRATIESGLWDASVVGAGVAGDGDWCNRASISIGLGTDGAVGAASTSMVAIGRSPARGCIKTVARCPKGRGTYRMTVEENAVPPGSQLFGLIYE
jgi:hypothetical protein